MNGEESLWRGFDRWWFGYGSPTALGLFRILMGGLIFVNFMMLTGDWGAWFGENGFVPAWIGQAYLGTSVDTGLGFALPRLDVIGGFVDPRITVAFFTLTIVVAFTTMLGLYTRISTFLLAICVVSLHHRDSLILHGGDTVIRLMAIYLAVSPSGRALSLDRLFRLRRGEEKDEKIEAPVFGQRLVQFNIALIYFTTVWAKWFGEKWLNGTATYYPARLAEFYRFPVPSFLNDFPFVYLTTYGTMIVEFSLATLVFFRPLRKYVLLGGVMLHTFIEYSMNIPLFSFLMVSCYVCHFDGEEVTAFCRRLGDRLRPRLGLEVTLPAGVRLSPNGERFLHAVDPFELVRYLPGVEDSEWDAKKDDGGRANPFRGVALRAPGAWPFSLVPTLWRRTMLGCAEAA